MLLLGIGHWRLIYCTVYLQAAQPCSRFILPDGLLSARADILAGCLAAHVPLPSLSGATLPTLLGASSAHFLQRTEHQMAALLTLTGTVAQAQQQQGPTLSMVLAKTQSYSRLLKTLAANKHTPLQTCA